MSSFLTIFATFQIIIIKYESLGCNIAIVIRYSSFSRLSALAIAKIVRIEELPNLPDYSSIDGCPPLFNRIDTHEYNQLSGKSTPQILGMRVYRTQYFDLMSNQ